MRKHTVMTVCGPIAPQELELTLHHEHLLWNSIERFARGLDTRLLVGHDLAYKHQLMHYGGYGYVHLTRDVVPVLKNHGLTDADVDRLLV